MIFGWLKSCYTTPARLWADSDDTIMIRWYRAAPGARVFPYQHAFKPRVWDDKNWPPFNVGPGECVAPHTWSPNRYPALPGDHFDGDPSWFLTGIPSEHRHDPGSSCNTQGVYFGEVALSAVYSTGILFSGRVAILAVYATCIEPFVGSVAVNGSETALPLTIASLGVSSVSESCIQPFVGILCVEGSSTPGPPFPGELAVEGSWSPGPPFPGELAVEGSVTATVGFVGGVALEGNNALRLIFEDFFHGADGTVLPLHLPDVGLSWNIQPFSPGTFEIESDAAQHVSAVYDNAIYVSFPSDGDFCILEAINVAGSSALVGVAFYSLGFPAGLDLYLVGVNYSSGNIELYEATSGVYTLVHSFTPSVPVGSDPFSLVIKVETSGLHIWMNGEHFFQFDDDVDHPQNWSIFGNFPGQRITYFAVLISP